MPYAVGSLYVRKHFDHESKEVVLEMFENIRETFREVLMQNSWIDEKVRKAALTKLDKMLPLFGYPDEILDDKWLDSYYETLQLTEKMTFLELEMTHATWTRQWLFRKVVEPVDRRDFAIGAFTVNAQYLPTANTLVFPAGILQAPFFNRHFPSALNYGSLGFVVGHEITHGFDAVGSDFDVNGNINKWWTETTRAKYDKKSMCMRKQYERIEVKRADLERILQVPETNLHLSGRNVIGEGIADNGGVKVAIKALKRHQKRQQLEETVLPGLEKFTLDQLFYIALGQSQCEARTHDELVKQILTSAHPPKRYRLNVALANRPEFARAFGCPKNSVMNPAKGCFVW